MTDNYLAIKQYGKSNEIRQIFQGIVGEEKAESYIYSVIVAVSANPELQECTPQSIFRSATRAATLGLSCDPSVKQAHLVPFYNNKIKQKECQFIPGWRGIRDMAYRTGEVAAINVNALYEGQEWIEDQLTGKAKIEGLPKPNRAIGYFAYLKTFSGREHFLYMSNDEINDHKEKYAKGYNREQSAWNTDYPKMAKKTVLLQLLNRWAPLDPSGIATVADLDSSMGAIDEMPDPNSVTVEKPDYGSNSEILDDLGFSGRDENGNIINGEFSENDEGGGEGGGKDKKEPELYDTSAPADIGEVKMWAMNGELKGITYKYVEQVYKSTGENLADTWAIIKEEVAKNKAS